MADVYPCLHHPRHSTVYDDDGIESEIKYRSPAAASCPSFVVYFVASATICLASKLTATSSSNE